MLFIDYDNIPPDEKERSVIKIEKISDFPEFDIRYEEHILDIRKCSKSVYSKIMFILDEDNRIDIFAKDPVPISVLSRINSIKVFPFVCRNDKNILPILIKNKGGKLVSKLVDSFIKE